MSTLKNKEQNEKEEKKYKIYCYQNMLNNKKYIGLTSLTLKERAGKDGHNYKDCTHFWNAIQKYGWNNFNSKVLEENLTLDEAKEKEKYYIKLYKTNDSNIGYNISKGGDGGFGIKRDESYREKFKYGNNSFARKVICITTNIIFDSISRACEYYHIKHHANISRACKNGTSCGKLGDIPLFWSYVSDDGTYEFKNKIYNNLPKKVLCVTTGEIFDSIRLAAKHYNIRHDAISLCCRKKAKSAGRLPDGTFLKWEWV